MLCHPEPGSAVSYALQKREEPVCRWLRVGEGLYWLSLSFIDGSHVLDAAKTRS